MQAGDGSRKKFGEQGLIRFSRDAIGVAATRLRRAGHVVVLAESHADAGFLSHAGSLPQALSHECAEAAGLRDPEGYLLRRRIARAVMAEALAGCAVPAADALRIVLSPHGGPLLARADAGLHLSFASRNGVNLIGIARQRIGVDLEPANGSAIIPWNILRPDEVADILALAENLRLPRFLALWTAKEAILKALGTGFNTSPEALKISRHGLVQHCQPASGDVSWSEFPVDLSHHTAHDVFHNIFYVAVALLPKPDIAPFEPDHF